MSATAQELFAQARAALGEQRTADAEALLQQALAARGPIEVLLDVRAAIPGVFLTLGWAAQWAVNAP